MEAGQLDVNIFAPPDTFIAADAGYNCVLKQSDLASGYPFHNYFGMEDFIEKNPNAIKAFLRGHIQGIRLAKANRELSIKTIIDHIGMKRGYAEKTYDLIIKDIYEDGRWPDEKSMQGFWDMGIMAGSYKERWPEEKYYISDFVKTYSEWKP
jgi:NitT/TauT family transport system substrate-binding protein